MHQTLYKKRTYKEAQEFLRGKKMQGDNLPLSIFVFFINLFVVLPIILCLLPLTIGFAIYHHLKPKKKTIYLEIDTVAKDIVPMNDRKYDLIMYGATGFTGKMACEYITRQYPTLKWAIGGRSLSKLQKIKDELVGIDPALEKKLDIIIADSFNIEQLQKLVKNTKVVISTVGPYSDYGSYLVALCAQYGTNYCDITGEFQWVQVMIEKYDNLAVKSGARIISCCGFDCIPFDMTTHFLGQELVKNHNQKLVSSDIYIEGNMNPSGGTLASIDRIMKNPPTYKTAFNFHPNLKLTGKNEGSTNKILNNLTIIVKKSKEVGRWIGFSALGVCNYAIVERTNALTNNYASTITYGEHTEFPNFFAACNAIFALFLMLPIIMITPLQNTLGKIMLPSPGEGPTQDQMNQGYLIITGVAKGEQGKKITAKFTLPTDPGYRDTARMIVESGLSLALNEDQLKVKGGFYTTASCLGDVLIQRLKDTGATMDIINN